MKNTEVKIRISERDKAELQRQATKLQMNMSEYIIYLIHKNEEKGENGMKVREYIEMNKDNYAVIDYECNGIHYDTVNGWTTDDTAEDEYDAFNVDMDEVKVTEMNMFQYILWINGDNYETLDEDDSEQIERIMKINEDYGYEKTDRFVILKK